MINTKQSKLVDFKMAIKLDNWIDLTQCPFDSQGYNPICINHDEIIMSAMRSLCKYTISSDEWIEWIKYPTDLSIQYQHSGALDKKENILYVQDRYKLVKINLNTQKIEIINDEIKSNVPPFLIVIDNKLHSIGGSKSISDLIWDKNKKKFIKSHEFSNFIRGFSEFGTIYDETNKLILFIGGYDWGGGGSTDLIYSHSFITNKTNALKTQLLTKMDGFGYILTRDKRYYIMFGGYNGMKYKYSDDIYIMDLSKGYDNIEIQMSDIKTPIARTYQAVIVGDCNREQLLTFGFIRNCLKEFNDIYLSDDLIKLTQSFVVCEEYVHLFATQGKKGHWKMRLDDILPRK